MFRIRSAPRLSDDGLSSADVQKIHSPSDELLKIADDFRAWVTSDLQALPELERSSFRGDYLFVIDGVPLFLVLVSPTSVSSARWQTHGAETEGRSLVADLGASMELAEEALSGILSGQVRVRVQTDSQTLRRLLQGTLRAKVAYISGMVKISGDLPCFMRLVAMLKGRGVGPARSSRG